MVTKSKTVFSLPDYKESSFKRYFHGEYSWPSDIRFRKFQESQKINRFLALIL